MLAGDSTPTDSTVSWAAAFERGLLSYDRSVLEDSPILLERVETKAEVKTALAVLGWIRALEEMSDGDLEELESAAELAKEVREHLLAARDRLDGVFSLVDAMKNTPDGAPVSVWDAATTLYPTLDEVAELSRTLRSELARPADQARRVAEADRTVLSHFDQVRSSRVTAFDRLPEAVSTTISAYSTIIEGVADIEERLARLREIGHEAADIADQLPDLGDRVESVFSGLESVLATMIDRFEAFRMALSERRDDLRAVGRDARGRANQQYSKIAPLVTDSIEELAVTNIETGVDASEAPRVDSVETPRSGGIDAVIVLGEYSSRARLVVGFYESFDAVELPVLVDWALDVVEGLPSGVPAGGSLTVPSTAAGPGWEFYADRYRAEYGTDKVGQLGIAYDSVAVPALASLAAGDNPGPAIRDRIRTVTNLPGDRYGPKRLPEAAAAVASGTDINYTGVGGLVGVDERGTVTTYTYRAGRHSSGATHANRIDAGRPGPESTRDGIPGSDPDRSIELGVLAPLSGELPARIGQGIRVVARLPALQLERSSPFSVDIPVAAQVLTKRPPSPPRDRSSTMAIRRSTKWH